MTESREQEMQMKAWLHRRNKPTWEFTYSLKFMRFVHVTRAGTVYSIMDSHRDGIGKPFWIASLSRNAWCTCEAKLRARSIEFENGGEYFFPSKDDR